METQPPRVIASQFRLDRELASGGMGTVYLAEQLGVARPVVVELMRASLSAEMPEATQLIKGGVVGAGGGVQAWAR